MGGVQASIDPAPPGSPPPSEPERRARRWPFALAAAGCALVALGVLGQLPGQVPYLPLSQTLTGQIACGVSAPLDEVLSGCQRVGVPLGLPMLTATTVVLLGIAYALLPGVSAYAASQLAMGTATVVALLAGIGVLRRLGTGRWAALGGSLLWLVSPTVVGLRYFPGTWTCLTLLPAFLLADMVLFERVRRGRDRVLVAVVAGYALIRCVAAFTDGYGFVVSAAATGCLLLLWPGVERPRWSARATAWGVVAVANALAFVAYRLTLPPGTPTWQPNIDQFRAMGADLVTFFAPTSTMWWADLSGIALDVVHFWGDGTNADYTYLGYGCLALAAVGLARPLRQRRWAAPLLLMLVVGFVLSLGPSLKVADTFVPSTDDDFDWYLMPAEDALVTLPTAVLHEHAPGLSSMRAVYRWHALTRLVLVLSAAVAVDHLWRRGRHRWLVAALAIVAVAEIIPLNAPPLRQFDRDLGRVIVPEAPALLGQHRQAREDLAEIERDLVEPLDEALPDGALVLFVPVHNDYLANFVVPLADLRSYNVGGDKNNALAARAQPPVVRSLATTDSPEVAKGRAFEVLAYDYADAIVVAHFSLRRDALSWPPVHGGRVEEPYGALLDDTRFVTTSTRWFTILTLPE